MGLGDMDVCCTDARHSCIMTQRLAVSLLMGNVHEGDDGASTRVSNGFIFVNPLHDSPIIKGDVRYCSGKAIDVACTRR